jgi:DNA-binding GntR family transcriptional regulator
MGLEREGVVRVVPHRGAFVERIDEQTVADHFELYALVDGFALRKACERTDDTQLAELAGAYERAGYQEDPERLQAAVIEARTILHELGGSPRFRAVARGLAGIVPGNFFSVVDGSMDIARRGLPEVAAGAAARDAPKAVDAYTDMMTAQGGRVLAALRRRSVIDADHDRSTGPTDQETP